MVVSLGVPIFRVFTVISFKLKTIHEVVNRVIQTVSVQVDLYFCVPTVHVL